MNDPDEAHKFKYVGLLIQLSSRQNKGIAVIL